MKYEFTQTKYIPLDIFDNLYESSISIMDSDPTGVNPSMFAGENTPEGKKQFLLNQYYKYIDIGLVVEVKCDGVPIALFAVQIEPEEPTHGILCFAIFGPDASGKRSWTTDPDWFTANRNFYKNAELGLTKLTLNTVGSGNAVSYIKKITETITGKAIEQTELFTSTDVAYPTIDQIQVEVDGVTITTSTATITMLEMTNQRFTWTFD